MKNGVSSFLLIMFCAFSIALAMEPVVWNGNADTKWYSENETEFTINTAEELAGLADLVNEGNNFKDKIVALGTDIILNDTIGWELWDEDTENLKRWTPIGNTTSFAGSFDGKGYKISGLYINTTDNYQGLFGLANSIKNLGVLASFIKGGDYVGGIAGSNGWSGSILDCHFIGVVKGSNRVGGIVGYNNSIRNSYSFGVVNGIGNYIGGIVGYGDQARVINSHSASTVNGIGNVGGIIGIVYTGMVQNSYFIGSVTGGNIIGGIAGRNDGTISESYSTGEVNGNNDIGGIVGANFYSGSVLNSYSTSNVTGNISVGGIAGCLGFMNSGLLKNNYSIGDIIGNNSVGGIVGTNYDGLIINNYSSGTINGTSKVGGIAGTIAGGGTIENNYSRGIIEGIDSVGGVAGNNYRGKVFNNYWNKTLNGAMDGVPYGAISEEDIGNLIGMIDTEMKSIQFVETLNAFVDSVNAAQTKIVYLSWYLNANYPNQGYPIFIYGLADVSVTLTTSSYIYDGNAKTPQATVNLGNVTLTENLDYTVSYVNNIDVGNATINITGINGYTGIKTVTFTIEPNETNIIQKLISVPNISILINAKHFQVQGIIKAEKVQLSNLKGSILLNRVVQPNETVSIAHLPQGIYFINVGGKTFKFSQISTF
jgi:hypothetical protein